MDLPPTSSVRKIRAVPGHPEGRDPPWGLQNGVQGWKGVPTARREASGFGSEHNANERKEAKLRLGNVSWLQTTSYTLATAGHSCLRKYRVQNTGQCGDSATYCYHAAIALFRLLAAPVGGRGGRSGGTGGVVTNQGPGKGNSAGRSPETLSRCCNA